MGTFAPGLRNVYFRAELGFFDGGPVWVTFVRPDGSVALDAVRPTLLQNYRATFATWASGSTSTARARGGQPGSSL
jgi:hypothetical protein